MVLFYIISNEILFSKKQKILKNFFRSKRRGFQRYIIGQLKECATRFFKEDIFVRIQDDISSNECKNDVFSSSDKIEKDFFSSLFKDTHIVFRVDFNNFMAHSIERRLMQGPKLPDVTGATFFKVISKQIFS
jgi:hypothetical protein